MVSTQLQALTTNQSIVHDIDILEALAEIIYPCPYVGSDSARYGNREAAWKKDLGLFKTFRTAYKTGLFRVINFTLLYPFNGLVSYNIVS